eukprot:6180696-Pleurochrysis_carterae.AAC.1
MASRGTSKTFARAASRSVITQERTHMPATIPANSTSLNPMALISWAASTPLSDGKCTNTTRATPWLQPENGNKAYYNPAAAAAAQRDRWWAEERAAKEGDQGYECYADEIFPGPRPTHP